LFTLQDLVDEDPLFPIRELLIPWLRRGNEPDEYTGLKDKKGEGEEIYAGDILKDKYGNFRQVVWMAREACWGVWIPSDTTHEELNPRSLSYGFVIIDGYMIAGNVCENPELLKERRKKNDYIRLWR